MIALSILAEIIAVRRGRDPRARAKSPAAGASAGA